MDHVRESRIDNGGLFLSAFAVVMMIFCIWVVLFGVVVLSPLAGVSWLAWFLLRNLYKKILEDYSIEKPKQSVPELYKAMLLARVTFTALNILFVLALLNLERIVVSLASLLAKPYLLSYFLWRLGLFRSVVDWLLGLFRSVVDWLWGLFGSVLDWLGGLFLSVDYWLASALEEFFRFISSTVRLFPLVMGWLASFLPSTSCYMISLPLICPLVILLIMWYCSDLLSLHEDWFKYSVCYLVIIFLLYLVDTLGPEVDLLAYIPWLFHHNPNIPLPPNIFPYIISHSIISPLVILLIVQFIKDKTSFGDAVDGVIHIVTIAVTIVVVAVPEGLPLAVTLILAYSMRKMMADKVLVRRLSACETMGSATTICSDKTGTLTLNEMTVVDAYIGRNKMNPPGDASQLNSEVLSLLQEGVAQNTTGNVFTPKDGGDVEVSGSPTEKAILSWAIKLGMKYDVTRSESSILHVFPFNSEKKRGGVAVRRSDSKVHIHWKGAAEMVLSSCTGYLDSNGSLQPIDDGQEFFRVAIDEMAARSLRCVAIAYRSYESDKVPADEGGLEKWALPEDDLVLLAIVGIKDPCRPGVKDAVRICTAAGVKVRMVTGDNLQTAKAIALECGILDSNSDVTEPSIIEGRVFRAYAEKEREQVAKKITVLARSSPNDKLLLVQALRKGGEVVAVTGDGTNDAPALHEADIGLSMGIQGTEVAKESSDIIILDDNFASVVKVVRWGRSVYANIQKFIQFQLTVNVAALVINVVAAVTSGDVPLNAVQLLWVNLIKDTLGALALATEPPTDHLMHRSPVGRREPRITNIMWRNLLIQALYQVGVVLVLNFRGKSILNLHGDSVEHATEVKNTMIFNSFVLCQVFNEFNARKPDEINVFRGVTKNHLFVGIVGFTVILQIILIEFSGKFTSTVKLSWQLWLASVAIGLVSWPLAAVGKLIPVPKTPLHVYLSKPFRRLRPARNS